MSIRTAPVFYRAEISLLDPAGWCLQVRFGTGAVKTPCWWGEEGAAVLAYFGQVEASQGGVAGGHPGYPQRHDVAHPQHFAQHRAGVGHVLLVLHGGLAALADHGVNFELHFLYRNQTKKKYKKELCSKSSQ